MWLVGWLGALAPQRAEAATYDPELTWRTLVTPHFRIHFHQGLEQLADELSREAEAIYDTLDDELRWRLRLRTEVVLVDPTDRANGFATAVPYNSVTLYVTAPQEDSTLSLYADWTEAIFTHELTHVIHMETHHGVVALARAVVGRIASTNDVSPWWMVEGLATFEETRQLPGGRGRTPYVDMVKRAAVVDDASPTLGNLDGLQARPPAGNLRYLFGQDFMQYVADHQGRDIWTRWIHHYGSSVPYLLPGKPILGKAITRLYREWRDEVHARYGRQIAARAREGLREGVAISEPGWSCSAPAFAPDDSRLVWSCVAPATGSSIWSAEPDGSGATKLVQDFGAKTFTWRSDGAVFLYAATHVVNRFNTWSDVFAYDVASGSIKALTTGARARDPDLSPDGSELVVVTTSAGQTRLEVLTIDGQRRRITPDEPGAPQYATPRYHPSGELLAVSIWEEGRRDLWLLGTDGKRLRRLTDDAAIDRDPAWSRDGRWLYFASDRSGVPDIYAIDLAAERLWQVTQVTTGAARPSVSPDGRSLAYERYRASGWEVRLMDLDPGAFLDRGPLPVPLAYGAPLHEVLPADGPAPRATATIAFPGRDVRPRPGAAAPLAHMAQDQGGIDTYDIAQVDDAYGDERDYPFAVPPRRYNPFQSLLPRYWAPTIQTTPRLPGFTPRGVFATTSRWPGPLALHGLQLSASTGASDPLRWLSYGAFISYRTDANYVGGGGSITINRWLPVFTLAASTSAVPRTYLVEDPVASAEAGEPVADDTPRTVFERRIAASFTFTWPFTIRSTIFASYDFSDRRLLGEPEEGVLTDTLALRGRIGRLSAGYRYAWGQPTALAISPEDARRVSIVGAILAPWLGTRFIAEDGTEEPVTQVQLSAEIREYLVNPWAPNHVLALRAAAGVSFGGSRFVGNYTLGGNVGDAAFTVRPPEYRMVRGYPFGADRGDNYWLLAAEYRLPLYRFDLGIQALPVFVRALHGAVFVDAGNAFNRPETPLDVFEGALVSVGAELRLDLVVGWAGGLNLRAGYAAGLTGNAFGPADPRSVYFQAGSSF
jgi:hypothetical protein